MKVEPIYALLILVKRKKNLSTLILLPENSILNYQLMIFRLGGFDYKYYIILPYPNINKH